MWGSNTSPSRAAGVAVSTALAYCTLSLTPATASADTLTIKTPGAHPNYAFEAEPHLLLGLIDPPGFGHGEGFGFGFRGTVEIVDNGFVPTINNTVGIGFGVDFVRYGLGRNRCLRRGAEAVCLEDDDRYTIYNVWLPVVLQWNFWLSRNWSVFGEPGLAFRFESSEGGNDDLHLDPLQLYVGGRYHFSESAALTLRLGYPTFSVGVSFLL